MGRRPPWPVHLRSRPARDGVDRRAALGCRRGAAGWWSRRGSIPDADRGSRPSLCVVLVAILVGLPAVRVETWHAPSSNKALVLDESLPLLGYSAPETYDADLLADLGTVVDGLGGATAGSSTSPTAPAGSTTCSASIPDHGYYHVSMAVPEFSQEDLVDSSRRIRRRWSRSTPPFGLPAWDGVSNEVRHFEVSQYLLDGWTPILSSRDVLFMLRNDLLADRPPVPKASPRSLGRHRPLLRRRGLRLGLSPQLPGVSGDGPIGLGGGDPSRPVRRIDLAGWAIDPLAMSSPSRIPSPPDTRSLRLPRPGSTGRTLPPPWTRRLAAPVASQLRSDRRSPRGCGCTPSTPTAWRTRSPTGGAPRSPDLGGRADGGKVVVEPGRDQCDCAPWSSTPGSALSTVDVPADVSLAEGADPRRHEPGDQRMGGPTSSPTPRRHRSR